MKTKRLLVILLSAAMLFALCAFGPGMGAGAAGPLPGETLPFGEYPQSPVTDTALTGQLDIIGQGDDVPLNGARYAWKNGTWFLYEPIEWRVLQASGSSLYLMAEKVLDAGPLEREDELSDEVELALGVSNLSVSIYAPLILEELAWRAAGSSPELAGWLQPMYYLCKLDPRTQFLKPGCSCWGGPHLYVIEPEIFLPTVQEVASPAFAPYRVAAPTEYAVAAGVYTDGASARWWTADTDSVPHYGYGVAYVGQTSSVPGTGINYDGSPISPAFIFAGPNTNAKNVLTDPKMGLRPVIKIDPAALDTPVTATFIDYDGTTQTTRTVNAAIPYGESAVTIMPPAQNTCSGWTPLGWTTSDLADAEPSAATAITVSGDTTFYGLYSKDLTLDYKVNGELRLDLRQMGQQRANSANITATADPQFTLHNITHPQYDFEGWTDNLTLEDYGAGQLLAIARNTTLVARLNTRSHTVTYDYWTNGGQSAAKATDTVYEGRQIDLTPTASKASWNFVGWNTAAGAAAGLPSMAMGAEDVTLYAIFQPIRVTGVYFTLHDWLNNPADALVYRWLEANIEPADAANQTVDWGTIPDPQGVVEIVDDSNDNHIRLIKVKAIGDVVFATATTQDGAYVAYCKVESTSDGVKITFTGPKTTMGANAQLQLEAAMIMAGAANGDANWSSDNTDVATVDGTGLVETHENGMAVITGTIELENSDSVMAEFAVVVDDGGDNNDGSQLKWWQKLPPWLQFILRWLCFGWVWMK